MLERTELVRDVNKNYDISIPSELKRKFEVGDHFRVYYDAETGAIAYVPNNHSLENKFMRNISSSYNEPKRNKYILTAEFDDRSEYLSLTDEQVDLFHWLVNQEYINSDFELVPFDENIKWLDV